MVYSELSLHTEIFKYHPRLGREFFGEVYALSDSLAAKVPLLEREDYIGVLENELWMNRELYRCGVHVPRPYGLYTVNIVSVWNLFGSFNSARTGFVMQRIPGTRGDRVGRNLRNHVLDLFWQEIDFAESKGFKPADENLGNSVYDKLEDRLYLIDFGFWTLKKD